MFQAFQRFIQDEAGVTPVEYALIAAIITVATTFAVSAAGYSLADFID